MFKRILLPTDGSETSSIAAEKIIGLAKDSGAVVVALHVVPEYKMLSLETDMLECTPAEFDRLSAQRARKYLGAIENLAKSAGVSCETVFQVSEDPYLAIIKAAEDKRCDLIAMASHGRRGVQALLIGSETQKVLTHSKIPVLVYR
jgi:nucleotide-binding universal stress UspA family protein